MRNTFLLLPLILLLNPCLGQEVKKRIKDTEDQNLIGEVKTLTSISVDLKENTKFVSYISVFSKEGMTVLEKVFEKDYGYEPERGTDSTTYTYDRYNRLTKETIYEWFLSNYGSYGKETRITSWVYTYNDDCDKVISEEYNSDSIYEDGNEEHSSDIETFQYNNECKLVYKEESNESTSYSYDTKDRLIKSAQKYGNEEKPVLVKSYIYNEENNSLTYLEYNEAKEVFREKEIQYYDAADNLIRKEYFNPPTWGKSILFSDGEKKEPSKVYLTKQYKYNSEDDLIQELHLGEDGKERIRVDIEYLENGIKQTFYKGVVFYSKEEWKYENGKLVEEKEYNSENPDKPSSIKQKSYLLNGSLKSKTTSYPEEKNTYKTEYEYDDIGNRISEKTCKNGKLDKWNISEIEYF